jgi:hypothetical protein
VRRLRGRSGAHAREMPLDVGPRKALPWLFHGHDDAARGIRSVEHQLTAPNQRALLSIGIDPKRIATNGDFLGSIARANGKHAWMKSRQTGDEPWLLRMQILHHDAFVVA